MPSPYAGPLTAYTSLALFQFNPADDPRSTGGQPGYVAPNSIILLDASEAAVATAQGTVSSTPPTLTTDQQNALTAANATSAIALGSRASIVTSMGLT